MKAIVLSMGNNQDAYEEVGLEHAYMNRIRFLASPTLTTYPPMEWVEDVDKLLQQFQRYSITELFLAGYSHGQVNCMELAEKAPQYGIVDIKMVLCDPVMRSKLLPKWKWIQFLSVRSLSSSQKIVVPPSVSEVWWVRQFVDLPAGHDLVAADPGKTKIYPAGVLPHTHSRIQWSQRWFDLLDEKAKQFAEAPPKAITVSNHE